MTLFLDSADLHDAKIAQNLGFIEGITTNPKLMAQASAPPLETLAELVEVFEGHVFYQVTAKTLEERIDEAWHAHDIRSDRVGIKIPATTENFKMIPKLSGVDIAVTAVYSPAQAYLAAQAEVDYVTTDVSHATQQLGDGIALIESIARVLAATSTQIIAAGITTIDQAMEAFHAGAQNLTMPLNLIEAMGNHDLSQQDIDEFNNL